MVNCIIFGAYLTANLFLPGYDITTEKRGYFISLELIYHTKTY